MKFLRNLVSAVLGGISIGIGSAAFYTLKEESLLIASFMFSLGFLAVVILNLNLFTDKAGYIFEKNRVQSNIKKLVITLLGNIIGALLTGFCFTSTLYDSATIYLKNDIYGSYLDIFISSLLCGVLIFIAIHGFRKVGGFAGCAILITASTMIMMCDFEYSLFNVFTVSAGIQNVSSYAALSLPIVAVIFLSAIGNALGAIIFASLYRFKENTDDSHRRHHHNHHHSNNTENKEEAGN